MEDDTTSLMTISEKILMNTDLSATSRPPYEVNYLETSIRTVDYDQDHPPRRTPYTNNNPLLRTICKRSPKIIFFGKDSGLLNITGCDPRFYDT